MELNEYQTKARKTAIYPNGAYAFLGLASEAGEVAALKKRELRDKQNIPKEQLISELGDCLWYISNIATDKNITLDEIGVYNIEKLKDRMKRNVIQGAGDNR
jgi:NTP pyrophosphatase (non-canonical NTP hydrolase)